MGRSKRLFLLPLVLCLALLGDGKTAFTQEPLARVYPLSLEEVTRLALGNNFDIQLAQYDTWIARTGQMKAESIYDTVLDAGIKYQNDQSKTASTIFGTKAIDNDYNIGLTKKFPTGTTVGLDLENNRNWTNSAFASSPLTHDSSLGVSIEQELGKNFFGLQDRGGIRITRIDIENTEYTSLEKIEDNVSRVQKAYWDLVLQYERVKIQEDMVAQAKRLHDLHQAKLEDGLVERAEALASEANYKRRQNDLLLVKNDVQAKENVLRLLLNIEREDVRIKPAEDFSPPKALEKREEALKLAFEHRRDYKKARNKITSKDITLSLKKNNIWPEINLTATLDRNGLGDHFKQAVTNITADDNPDLFAGLTISMPLENREARADLEAASLEKAKSLVSLKLLERTIAIEIMDQVRDCNVFRQLVVNTERIADLQTQKLEEEEKRFRRGRSDTDTLIRFQEDAVQARWEEAQAKHRYHAGLVDLKQRSGVLLNGYWEGEL